MKKILSAILAAILCASFSFMACTKKTEETIADDEAVNVIAEETSLTMQDVEGAPFTAILKASASDKGIIPTLYNIVEYGSLYYSVGIENINIDLWASEKENSYGGVVDLEIEEFGDVSAYITDKSFAISSDSLLGGKTYGFSFENFKENFENAKFLKELGLTAQDIYDAIETEIGVTVDEIVALALDYAEEAVAYEAKYSGDYFTKILDTVKHTVEEKELDLASGKIDTIAINCSLDYDFVAKLFDAYIDMLDENPAKNVANAIYSMMDLYMEYDDIVETYRYMAEELEEFYDEYIESLDLVAYINADTSKLAYLELKADVFVNYLDEIGTAIITIDFSNPEKVVFNMIAIEDGKEIHNENLTVSEKLSADKYILSIDHEANDIKTQLFSFNIDRKANRFVLSAAGANIEGEAKLTENSIEISPDGLPVSLYAKLTDKEVELRGEIDVVPFNFVLRAEDLPKIPEYKNIFEITLEEFIAIGENFASIAEYFGEGEDFDDPTFEYRIAVEYETDREALEEYAKNMYTEDESYYARVEGDDVLVLGAILDEADDEAYARIDEEISDIADLFDEVIPVFEEEAQAKISALVIEYVTTDGDLIARHEFR